MADGRPRQRSHEQRPARRDIACDLTAWKTSCSPVTVTTAGARATDASSRTARTAPDPVARVAQRTGRAADAIAAGLTESGDAGARVSPSVGTADGLRFLDVRADFSNEPVGGLGRVAAGAEGVSPLAICEAGQQASGPSDGACCDAMLKQRLRARVSELDEAVPCAGDEPALLVAFGSGARAERAAGVAERAAWITDDAQCSTCPSIETR